MSEAAKLNVYERIQAVMRDLPYVQKRKEANVGGGRLVKTLAYEDLAAEVQPLLVKHGLVLLSTLEDLKVETIESEKPGFKPSDPPKKAITTIATVKMKFCLVTVDEEVEPDGRRYCRTGWLTFPGMGYDTSDKAVGKATTYAAKDFMRKVFVVPAGEEPEDDNHEHPAAKAHARAQEAAPAAKAPAAKPAAPKLSRDELERLGLAALCSVHKAQFGEKATLAEMEPFGPDLKTKGVKDFGLGTDSVAGLRHVLACRLLGEEPYPKEAVK